MGDLEPALMLLAFIAALAAALKGIQVLLKAGIEGGRRAKVLDDLTDADGWPNGATSLKTSHVDLYDKVVVVENLVISGVDRIAGLELAVQELTTSVEQALGKELP